MNELNENERVERLLAEGKLTAEEAARLKDSLAAHAEREAPLRAAANPRDRRRLWLLFGSLAVFFLLGAATHYLFGDVAGDVVAPPPTESTTASALPEGRLIDLSGLAEERSTTMKRSLPLSLGVVTIGVLAVLAALLVFFYNGLIGAREQVNSGWAQVENVYQRRLDLVPVLVDAVQTYVEHERETLEARRQDHQVRVVEGRVGIVRVSGEPDGIREAELLDRPDDAVAAAIASTPVHR